MKIVLVAEAWGRHEHEFKHPLVGPTGRELALQLGQTGLAPYMLLECRNCKKSTEYRDNFCTHCHEYVWPNSFDLMAHWKRLRERYSIAVTNVFNEHPPEICRDCGSMNVDISNRPFCKDCRSWNIRTNDLGWFFGTEQQTDMLSWKASKTSPGSHIKREHFHHVERLWRELSDWKPNLVIALGNAACWAVLFQTKITELRGAVVWSDKCNVKVLPTFHPSAVLHQPNVRTTVLADLTKARREAEFPDIRRTERWFTVPAPNADGIREAMDWLRRPHRKLTNDIETIRNGISIVGFGSGPDQALVIPFRDAHTDDRNNLVDIGKIARDLGFASNRINYWPSDDLEFQAWKAVQFGLNLPCAKVFQNGVFDISYYLRMGLHVNGEIHDTMLWHHSKYPELRKGLDYLGSIYTNEISWKQMRRHHSIKRDE